MLDAGAILNLKSCSFVTNTVYYLGYVAPTRRLKIALHTMHAVKGLQAARNVAELKSSLGLCNVSRWLVIDFGRFVFPLGDKIRKDQPFKFEQNEKKTWSDGQTPREVDLSAGISVTVRQGAKFIRFR